MRKSSTEIALIRAGANTADVGGYAIREAIAPGVREIDVAMAAGYREHDILVITDQGADNITAYPYGPGFNVVG